MFHRKIISSFLVSIGLILFSGSVFAESDPSSRYRVLSSQDSGLNISAINAFLDQAEVSINSGNLDEAVEKLNKARTVSSLLITYYKDINGSFKGIDALIPREMSKKNRELSELLAKANMQLASIHRSEGEHELAVPLLVDVVKILTPIDPKGSKAYQQLFELGFVETPYRGAPKQSL
tara:strand:- start:250 stop:783 length:534 start_codon:yes stop_codon:yes gene_type:complete